MREISSKDPMYIIIRNGQYFLTDLIHEWAVTDPNGSSQQGPRNPLHVSPTPVLRLSIRRALFPQNVLLIRSTRLKLLSYQCFLRGIEYSLSAFEDVAPHMSDMWRLRHIDPPGTSWVLRPMDVMTRCITSHTFCHSLGPSECSLSCLKQTSYYSRCVQSRPVSFLSHAIPGICKTKTAIRPAVKVSISWSRRFLSIRYICCWSVKIGLR